MAATITPQSVWDQDRFPNLETQVGQEMWPTIRASDGEKGGPNMAGSKGDLMLPSAVTQQWGTPRQSMAQDKDKDMGKSRLGEQVQSKHSGKLNPRWVETLMGLPIGWTTPICAKPWIVALTSCDSSATVLTQMSPLEHS